MTSAVNPCRLEAVSQRSRPMAAMRLPRARSTPPARAAASATRLSWMVAAPAPDATTTSAEDEPTGPGSDGRGEPEGERAEDARAAHVAGHVEPARLALVVGVGGHGDERVERRRGGGRRRLQRRHQHGEDPEVAGRVGNQGCRGEQRRRHPHHGEVPELPAPDHVDERYPEDLEGVGHEAHRRHRGDVGEGDPRRPRAGTGRRS